MVPLTTSFEEKDRVKSGGDCLSPHTAIYRPLCSLGMKGIFCWRIDLNKERDQQDDD